MGLKIQNGEIMSDNFQPIRNKFHVLCKKCKFWRMNYHRVCPKCESIERKRKKQNAGTLSLPKFTERSRSDETDKKEPMTKAEYNSELDEIRGDIKRENEENV